MAKRGGSGKSLFQDLCALPDPSKDSWPMVERHLLEAKSHLLALRPADPEAVIDVMIAMQMHTLLQQGTLLPDERYREAYRLVLDGVERQLDAPGQLGPLPLAKMKEFGAQLQMTLQSRGLSEVCQRWNLRGLGIRDLEILGTSSWTLGGRGFEQSNYGLRDWPVASAYGPSTEGAGTRVCGYAIKNSGLTGVR